MKRLFWMFFVATIAACGTQTSEPQPTKPAADPDTTVGERADALSNQWTDIVGTITPDGPQIEGTIDYPSWFHGYTMELEAGQELNFQVSASEDGYVRLYGPSLGIYRGQEFFTNAEVREYVTGGTVTEFVYEIEEDGVYMLLYGPEFVWTADYTMSVQSVGVPSCADDSECAADEYCGDNGVRCITYPCTANYDICKPQESEGSYCENDRACAGGLSCQNNTCTAVADECAAADDCAAGEFCGHDAAGGRVCKAFAAEGDRCGGFVRPEDYMICEPDLSCTAPDFVADIPGYCGQDVTVADLMAHPGDYDGRFVAVKGYVGAGLAYCTRMACPTDNPCCNTCGADEMLFAAEGDYEGIKLAENGVELGCSGDDCSLDCATGEGIYWVGGWFRPDGFGGGTIDIVRKMQGF